MESLPTISTAKTENSQQYITFKIGEELYGIAIMAVKEVMTPRPVTVIPRTPKYLIGIINLRGEVISVIDLRIRFGLDKKEMSTRSRIIVVVANGMKMGILVDSINAIMTLDVDDLRNANMIVSSDKQKFVSGSYKLSEDSILLILLQDKIIDENDFQTQLKINQDQELLSVEVIPDKDGAKEIHLVGFSVRNEQYSVVSLGVEEIIFLPKMTTVPEMDSFVEGIFYLRESLIPVIRLGKQLGLGKSDTNEDTPVIIVNIFNMKVGLIVDEITGVFSVPEEEIKTAPIHISKNQAEQLKGVIRLTRENQSYIIMVLKLEKLFSFQEQDLLRELDYMYETEETQAEKDTVQDLSIFEFMLAGDRYAIDLSEANEIIPICEFVPVPKAPPYIKGIINLRGDVVSVIDLPKLVSHHDYRFDRFTKLLIVNTGNEIIGLIIEKVLGIRKVISKTFEPPSDILQQKGNIYIKGIGKDDTSDDIIILMDVGATLEQIQSSDESESLNAIFEALELLELEDERAEQAFES